MTPSEEQDRAVGVVLGVDVGGTGVRVVLSGLDPAGVRVLASGERRGPTHAEGHHVATTVAELARETIGHHPRPVVAVVGCTGVALLGNTLRDRVAAAVADSSGARTVAICSDLLTGYLGALGFASGAVLAAGTGAVALGTDLRTWRRADGWGHLLGDAGGGAWIGGEGVRAALRELDGRPGGSAKLLALLRQKHGDPAALVAELTPRPDRAGVLAGFAPDVITAAETDRVAADIVRRAAGHLAETLLAVCPPTVHSGAVTGNLLQAPGPLATAFTEAVRERDPDLRLRPPHGTPLDGAATLAAAVLRGSLSADLSRAGALTISRHTTPVT